MGLKKENFVQMLHRIWLEEIKLVPFTTNILYEENCNFIPT